MRSTGIGFRRLAAVAFLAAAFCAAVYSQSGSSAKLASAADDEGDAKSAAGDYRGALAAWEKAANYARDAGNALLEAYTSNKQGMLYNRLAEYSSAKLRIERAISLIGRAYSVDLATRGMLKVEYMGNLATTYYSLNMIKEAIDLLNAGLPVISDYLASRPGDKGGLTVYARYLTNLGVMISETGNVKEAITRTEEALSVSEKLALPLGLLRNNLGTLYSKAGDAASARKYLELSLADPTLSESEKAVTRSNLAGLSQDARDDAAAVGLYDQAIESMKKLNRPSQLAELYRNRASVSYGKGDYAAAEKDFRSALDVIEKIRSKADAETRAAFFAGKFYSYQWLVDTLIRQNKVGAAFDQAERASARVLVERLNGGGDGSFATWGDFSKLIPEDTVVIRFFNADWNEIVVFAATARNIKAGLIPAASLFSGSGANLAAESADYLKTRGLELVGKGTSVAAASKAPTRRPDLSFDNTIRCYRALLAEYGRGAARTAALNSVCDGLSGLFVRPLEDVFKGKKRVLVIPDGITALIPYETLKTSAGRYLAQDYEISYAQSLTALSAVWNRSYPETRKTAAVFAGASYRDLVPAAPKAAGVREAIASVAAGKAAMGDLMAAAGYGSFPDLPGTVAEAKSIAAAAPNVDLVLGRPAREAEVKRLSASGDLAKYRFVHFATHGAFIESAPEYTSIVMGRRALDAEDGFLVSDEVSALKLHADLVTLSACETGLGASIAGEGVTGLAQAFMRAGANAVLVSLWKVVDEPTAAFMADFYRELAKPGTSTGAALAEAKRRAIGSADRSDPALWAPFVLYGKF